MPIARPRAVFNARGAQVVRVDRREKQTWRFELTLKAEDFVGEIEDNLRIHTTNKETPLITVSITGEMRGDLRISPPSAFFGFVKPGAKAQQDVLVESRSGTDFTIRAAKTDSPKVNVAALQHQDGRWSIPISVDTSQPGILEGTVRVTTDVPDEEKLQIPVYAHILRPQ